MTQQNRLWNLTRARCFRGNFLELLYDLVDLMLIDLLHVVRDRYLATAIGFILAS
jgi:hypothetical protein